MPNYYDGTKLLSMRDINGDIPEIYICTSNRTAGKTTYFNRKVHNGWKKNGKKYMLIYRFNYELDDVVDKFYKDIQNLFFQDEEFTAKKIGRGIAVELYSNGNNCGYAVSLNNADSIKKYSHLFSDTACMVFDEFQSETNHYCDNELKKFQSIHTSVSRGNGEQVRYVPVYMISNPVTIINPYYVSLGISSRLQENTHFLKGNGFVLEQGFNESACEAQKSSGFNKAFAQDDYQLYASQGIYLNDNKAFIEKPEGIGKYLCTIKVDRRSYAIREFAESGVIYCDDKPDMSFPIKLAVTLNDHDVNYVMLKRNELFISNLRWYFDKGCFRFKDLSSKDALMKTISYI